MNSALATIAANVAAALANVDTATDAASTVKFNALLDFATGVALRLRVEHINTGSNLETDSKGRIVALVDASKQNRAALVTALTAAGVKDKDAANIASMGRTVALHFVNGMVTTGSIRTAPSGQAMRDILHEALTTATGQQETYNAVEKARGRKWEAPTEGVETAEHNAVTSQADTATDMEATLDSAPAEEGPQEPVASTPQEVLDAETGNAIRILQAAVERGDIETLISKGFRQLLAEGLTQVTAHEQTEARAKAEEEAAALEAKAQAKRNKAA